MLNRHGETAEQTIQRLARGFRLQRRGFVCLADNGVVENGYAILAVFPNVRRARHVLVDAGFVNTHQNIWKIVNREAASC